MSSRPRLGAALGLVLGLVLVASCDRPGVLSQVPGSDATALAVPYPIAEPERIEGAGRQALRAASFVFIGRGTPSPDHEHALPEPLSAEGPVLIAHHVEPEGPATRTWQQLRRLAFGRVTPEPGRAVEVAAAEVEALGLQPPATTVWLVGPRGTCRTTVGAPVVGTYRGAADIVVVGYRLEGCPARSWAPIGIVADTIPVDFRWVPAEPRVDRTQPRPAAWDDPLATLVEPPDWTHASDPRFDQVRLREIPDASPRVIQVHRAWLSDSPDQTDQPWCDIDVAWSRTDGWYNERWIDPIPWPADAVGPFMLGAFVNGTQVDAVIYDDRLDGLVVIPPGPLDDMDDPEAWHHVFVPTGNYDERTLAAWGVQPARGPAPVGPACAPAEPFAEIPAETSAELSPEAFAEPPPEAFAEPPPEPSAESFAEIPAGPPR